MLRKKKTKSLKSSLLAASLGALLVLAYAPFNWWWVTFFSLTLFFVLLQRTENPTKIAFSFGLGWFGAGISWVHVSIAQFGGMPLIASVALMAVLVAYLSIYPAIFGHLSRKIKANYWPLCLPLIWLSMEFLRGWVLTGFPWLSLGYTQTSSSLSGFFPIIGEFGVSAVLIFVTSSIAVFCFNGRLIIGFAPILLALCLGWFFDKINWVTKNGEAVDIALVQGNIEQSLKWQPELEEQTIQKHIALSQEHLDADLIIWPEAAIPKLEPLAYEHLHKLDQTMNEHQVGFVTGIVNYNFETDEAYNTLLSMGFSGEGQIPRPYQYGHSNRYDKHHLLPIGEFVPLENWLRGISPLFDLPMSSFDRGPRVQSNIMANNILLAPAICFEIAFPSQIRQNLTEETHFILTVSNDAWFGNSHGPHQHMQIAQARAKEFGIPVIRSTNNGVTALVNHKGELHSQIPQFEAQVLRSEIQPVTGKTLYAVIGNGLIWIISLISYIFGYVLSKREKHLFH